MKYRFIIAAAIAVTSLTGCSDRSIMGCTFVESGCDAVSSSPTIPDNKQLEQKLQAAGFTKPQSEGDWQKGDDTVHLVPNLGDSYITVLFPGKGRVRCDSIFITPTQPDPVSRINEIKAISYELALAGRCKSIK